MNYLFDANAISAVIARREPLFSRYQGALARSDRMLLSAVAHFEVRRGLLAIDARGRLSRLEFLRREMIWVPVEDADWEEAAQLYVRTRQTGRPRDDADLLIAAQGRLLGATIVTRNVRNFADLTVATEDWETP